MPRYAALFRAVNLPAYGTLSMADLSALLERLGLRDVQTVLQSGNAVFSCPPDQADTAASQLEDAIAGEFGFACRVIVRTAPELAAAISADPLLHLVEDPSRHVLGFLSDPPLAEGVARLSDEDFGIDQLRIVDRHVYLWCPNGLMGSPFGKLNFDRVLGVAVTMRNWNTVSKLAGLLAAD